MILERLEGGVVQPPLACAGLEQGWGGGGAPPPSLNESERQMENSRKNVFGVSS